MLQLSIESDTYSNLLLKAEKEIIFRALLAYKYNITKTAEALHMSRITLRNKIKQFYPTLYS